ncbi:MAG: PAS domain-containing protein [Afipia sp.]|nr:PAS domain-containing protein [Afipia sp.]
MDQPTDPAQRLNAKARNENWPSRADPSLAFEHPNLVQMRELWTSLAGAGRLPSRTDLSFQALKPFLPNLAVLKIVASEDGRRCFRHSYVGTEIAHRFGEITGLCFEDFLPPELLPRTLAFIETVVEIRRPLRIVTRFRLKPVDYLYAEIFVVPLADDGITPDRLISVSHFSAETDVRTVAELAARSEI